MLKRFADSGRDQVPQHQLATFPRTQPGEQAALAEFAWGAVVSRDTALDVARSSQGVDGVNSTQPVHSDRSTKSIHSDSRVLITAFDLSAIELVLELSEGRGGLFILDFPVPKYQPSGREPVRIDIRSQSGRPLLARPTERYSLVGKSFWKPYQKRLNALKRKPGAVDFRRDVWSMLLQAAADVLTRSGSATRPVDVENWYRGWSRYQMDSVSARRSMLQSLGVATGLRALDIPFALGETWRELVPHIEALANARGAKLAQQDMYVEVCSEMQRVALGPSPMATAKLLSLLRARVLTIGPSVEAAMR